MVVWGGRQARECFNIIHCSEGLAEKKREIVLILYTVPDFFKEKLGRVSRRKEKKRGIFRSTNG